MILGKLIWDFEYFENEWSLCFSNTHGYFLERYSQVTCSASPHALSALGCFARRRHDQGGFALQRPHGNKQKSRIEMRNPAYEKPKDR